MVEDHGEKLYYSVPITEDLEQRFLLNMLNHNNIPGLLPMHYQYVDEQIRFIYETKGLLPLQEYCSKSKLSAQKASLILQEVIAAICMGEPFFLQQSGYCMMPSYIYIDTVKSKVALCYFPETEEEFEQGFRRLIEFFLENIDHTNKKALTFFYSLYDLICEEGVVLSDIQEYLILYEKENNLEKCKDGNNSVDRNDSKYKKVSGNRSDRREKQKVSKGTGFKLVLCDYRGRSKITYNNKRYFESIVPQEISLREKSYQIGRLEGQDICLLPCEVSRIHAGVEVMEQDLYVVDYGSTNGTFVNGRKLSAHVKTRCVKNDVITFADISYRVISNENEAIIKKVH